jgi:hypothetical protein
MATAIVGLPRNLWIPVIQDDIIADVVRQPWKNTRDIVRELGEAKARLLEILLDGELDPTHRFFQTIVQ